MLRPRAATSPRFTGKTKRMAPRLFWRGAFGWKYRKKWMFRDYTLQTTWGRALKGLGIGIVVGALIIGSLALLMFNAYIGGYMFYFQGRDEMGMVKTLTIAFGLPLVVWGMWGVIFAPIWLLLHKLDYRTWLSLILAGFALTFFVVFMLSTNYFTGIRDWPERFNTAPYMDMDPRWHGATLTAFGWRLAGISAAISGVFGAVVAFSIWRSAYKRPVAHPC